MHLDVDWWDTNDPVVGPNCPALTTGLYAREETTA
jgi:hypothetical protein